MSLQNFSSPQFLSPGGSLSSSPFPLNAHQLQLHIKTTPVSSPSQTLSPTSIHLPTHISLKSSSAHSSPDITFTNTPQSYDDSLSGDDSSSSSSTNSSIANSDSSSTNTSYLESPSEDISFRKHSPISFSKPSSRQNSKSKPLSPIQNTLLNSLDSHSSTLNQILDTNPATAHDSSSDSRPVLDFSKPPTPEKASSLSLLRKRYFNKLLDWQTYISSDSQQPDTRDQNTVASSWTYSPPLSPTTFTSSSSWCTSPSSSLLSSPEKFNNTGINPLRDSLTDAMEEKNHSLDTLSLEKKASSFYKFPENSLFCGTFDNIAPLHSRATSASQPTVISSSLSNSGLDVSSNPISEATLYDNKQLGLHSEMSSVVYSVPTLLSEPSLTPKAITRRGLLHSKGHHSTPSATENSLVLIPGDDLSHSSLSSQTKSFGTGDSLKISDFAFASKYLVSPRSVTPPQDFKGRKKQKSQTSGAFSTRSLSVFGIMTFLFLAACLASFFYYGNEPKNCRMSYMSPSYIHLSQFNQNYTRHHSKYSLYLYRERTIDDENTPPRGIPVLFIPGNAGSYRQVRALAAQSASHYRSSLLRKTKSKGQHTSSSVLLSSQIKYPQFDFYTADFNEDLTAFHGGSLLDQAEYLNDAIKYILSLYNTSNPTKFFNDHLQIYDNETIANSHASSNPSPQSVILLGHSMGGFVARTMFAVDNFQKGSVNTVFTLSAPHTLPPAPFDKDVVAVYDRVNLYWENSFSQDFIGRNPLALVSLISISGGPLDRTVTSESTSVSSFVPPSNGFTVFTSSIPHVWSSTDHQAIVWSDQLRDVFTTALGEMSDVRIASKTKPLPDRMNIFRNIFLGGFQMGAAPDYLQTRYHPSLGVSPEVSTSAGIINSKSKLGSSPMAKHHGDVKNDRLLKVQGSDDSETRGDINTKQTVALDLGKQANDIKLKDQPFTPPAVGDHDTLLWIEDITKFTTPPTQKLTIRKLGENQEHVEDDQVFNSGGRAYFMPISSDLISVPQNELEFTFMTDNPLIPYQPIVPQTCSEDSACVGEPSGKGINSEIPFNFKSGKAKTGLYALVCRYPHAEIKHSGSSLNVIDLTKRADGRSDTESQQQSSEDYDDQRLVGLLCKNIADDASVLPHPNRIERLDFDEENDGANIRKNRYKIPRTNVGHLSYIKYDALQLAEYDFMTIIDTNPDPKPGFAVAEFSTKRHSRVNVKTGVWELLFQGVSLTLPSNRPFMVDVSFQNIWSSLLAYVVTIKDEQAQCRHRNTASKTSARSVSHFESSGDDSNRMFKTFIRQYAGDSYESKYYMDVRVNQTIPINIAGVAPFSPFGIREKDTDFEGNLFYYGQKSHYYHNLHLQFWSDSSTFDSFSTSSRYQHIPKDIQFVIKLDWAASFGRLIMPYRTVLICFPVAVISTMFLFQFSVYNTHGVFISAEDALVVFIRKYLIYFVVASFVFPYFGNLQIFRDTLYFFEPGMDVYSGDGPASIFTYIRRNQFFLGLEPGHLPLLGPFFILIAVGLTVFTIALLKTLILVLFFLVTCIQMVVKLFGAISKHTVKKYTKEDEKDISRRDQNSSEDSLQAQKWITSQSKLVRRAVITTFLFIAVSYTIPCEFAYFVSLFVQLSTVITAYTRVRAGHTVLINGRGEKIPMACFYNFCFSILLLMFWIVPIAAPILIVWGRKMVTARWNEPFQSHHNLLSIGPILFLVETISSGKIVPRTKDLPKQIVTYTGLILITTAALLVGVQRTYLLYRLVNIFSAWLLVLFIITTFHQTTTKI